MTTQHDKAKRWRPWRFGLRTLLLLMLVVGCYFAGWTASERKQQRERIQQIKAVDLRMDWGLSVDVWTPGPYVVDGVITATWGNSVDVGIGSDDGLRRGQLLTAFRDNNMVACFEVTDVSPDDCSARVLMSKPKTKVGDTLRAFIE